MENNIKFAGQKNNQGREEMAVAHYCTMRKLPFHLFSNYKTVPEGFIPVGSVEWCLNFLKKPVIPDYYPTFLEKLLFRKVWKTDTWPLGKKIFIKPADKYKRFTGFVTNGGYKGKKRPPYWCSDVVRFQNEWRYYIADGQILDASWYFGDEINTPDAPDCIKMVVPSDFCGAIDLGELSTGEIALVEVNHPFACGWYGKDHDKYVEWLIKGWTYMQKLDNMVS
jgi:hypothetical protein